MSLHISFSGCTGFCSPSCCISNILTEQETEGMEDYRGLKVDTKEHTGAYHQSIKSGSQRRQLYQCETCDFKSNKKYSLIRHVKHIHDRSDAYRCKTCGKTEIEKCRLKEHIEVEHEGRRWICEICGSPFKSSGGLSAHIKVKHADMVMTEAKFKCSKCSKSFVNKDLYVGHMSKHDGTKLFSCGLCSKRYQYRNNLKNHMVKHHREKDYKCDHCEMCFSTNKDLQNHVNGKHSQLETYRCDCGKRFRWRSSLHYHRHKCTFYNNKPSS